MKKFAKILSVALVALMLCTAFVACMGGSNKLNGTYVMEEVEYGTGYRISMTFSGNKVTTKYETMLLGQSESETQEGTYEIVEEDGQKYIKIDFEDEDLPDSSEEIDIGDDFIIIDGIKLEKQ